ncbi:LytR/AlgR family response regulator transcription factor [Maribacter sp. 2307ULW6-5]|uniref:LytR/AlgR family response regulator transcription factor n=1 Tax=Maribacter sp. 2307ULW6-5 TaxID=3386275 RepID=UPI0039BC59CB
MELTAIVVDDEPTSREILTNYMGKYCPGVRLLGEAGSMEEALALIGAQPPDVVFLDVEMPFGNAFDFLAAVPDRSFETVFVTAYEHYAKDALNQQAAYYLTKPIDIGELIHAVDHVLEIRSREKALEDQVLRPKMGQVQGKITLPQQDGFEVLDVADILYCRADDNYTEIFLENKRLVVSKTLKYFEEHLSQFAFARTHKSYLVNVNRVVKYKKGKGGSLILSNGRELLVSASRKKAFLAYFK